MDYRFLHIPKTGGSSLKVNFINNNIHFPMDHLTIYDKNDKCITIIRDPIDQVASRFKTLTEGQDVEFKDWFTEESFNMQSKHLKLRILNKDSNLEYLCPITPIEVETIIQILKNIFYKVLITEKLDLQMPQLLKEMKVPLTEMHCNIAKKRYTPTEKDKKLIREKCALDFKLYNAFK